MKTIILSDEEFEKVQSVLKKTETVHEKKKGVTIYKTDGSVLFESDKETIKEAVRDADLFGANLRDANLSYADLRGANLRDADLSDADLRWADLSDANLSDADLRGADLSDADLRGAELNNAKFYGKGGTVHLKKEQVKPFLAALGFIVE